MCCVIRAITQFGKRARRKKRKWSKNREVKGLEKVDE
jgi:hypothetical protein